MHTSLPLLLGAALRHRCLGFLLPALTLSGQTPEGLPEGPDLGRLIRLLNTPVTSASKREQSYLEAPQAMEIITRAQIQQMGAFRLQDVLRQATSLNLLELDPQSAYAGMRGNLMEGYPKNIQVLIDGVPFYNAIRGAVDLDNLPIPIDLIEKIEIVRGPCTPLYGSGAVGGVIAISTRQVNGSPANVRLGTGERRQNFAADLSHRRGDFQLVLGVDGASSRDSGFPYRPLGNVSPLYQPSPDQSEQLTHDAFHQFKALVRSEYSPGSATLTLSAGKSEKKTGVNFGTGFTIPFERFEDSFAKLGWRQPWTDSFRTELSLHASNITATTGEIGKPESTLIDYTTKQVSFQANAEPGADFHLVAGWDARSATASSVLGGLSKGTREQAWGVFVILDWTFLPSWDLSLGGRYENDSLGGSRTSPRAVLSHQLSDNSNLRFGYYTSARSPQVLEARITASAPSRIIPNPGLEVEKTESLELGYRLDWRGWTFDATLFDMTYDDLIARMTVLPTPPPSGTRQYVNVSGKARDRGLELMVQKQIVDLVLGANLTLLSFQDRNQVDMVYTPKGVANLFARFNRGGLSGYCGLQYVGQHQIGNYLGTPTFEQVDARVRGMTNLGVQLSARTTLLLYGLNLGGRNDAQGAGGSLQSPILRGTQRELGLALSAHW
jgi:outer membrane cobalamin receptor